MLDAAAKNGIVVFASSAGRFVLLPECRMAGQYRYFAIKPQRQRVSLRDRREVEVNVPLPSDGPASGPPVSLDLVRVGRLTTTRRTGAGAALLGSCDGASHFARTLSVGQVVGEALGPGQQPACLGAPIEEGLPSALCRRFLRAELVALKNAKLETSGGDITFCPAGWALSEGACVPRDGAGTFECRDDAAECRVQCERGSAPSCARIGYLLAHGEGGFVRNEAEAVPFYQRACELGHAPACFYLGVMYALEGQPRKDEKVASDYWDQACADGFPAACSNLGLMRARDASTPAERGRAIDLLARACAGGDPLGCMNAALVMRRSDVEPPEQEVGLLLDLSCDGDVAAGCLQLSDWLARHGAPPETTQSALDKACRLGSPEACSRKPASREM
jgi:hypothetical protein